MIHATFEGKKEYRKEYFGIDGFWTAKETSCGDCVAYS